MSQLIVGYARCSTDQQDLTAQRDTLTKLGIKPKRIYIDHGLTGTNKNRAGLREALATCRAGDTLAPHQTGPGGPLRPRRPTRSPQISQTAK